MGKPLPAAFVAEVRRLTEEDGLSAAQVAARMRTTRSAVIGLWNRHGMRPARRPYTRKERPEGRGRQQPSLPPILERLPKYDD